MTPKYYSVAELTRLWRQVTLIPTDGRDHIEQEFLQFKAGTHLADMKAWFNSQHTLFSVDSWRATEAGLLKAVRLGFALEPANLVVIANQGICLRWHVVEETKLSGHPEVTAATLWMTDGSVIDLKEGEIAKAEMGADRSEMKIPRQEGPALCLRFMRLRRENLEEILVEPTVKQAIEADPSLRWQLQLTSMGARCIKH